MDGSKGTKESEFEHDWMCDKKANVHDLWAAGDEVRDDSSRFPQTDGKAEKRDKWRYVWLCGCSYLYPRLSKVFGIAKILVTEPSRFIQASQF